MGRVQQFLHISFCMNNKREQGKKSFGAGTTRLGEFWSMLENFWSNFGIEN
jgi:hypothetical protein